MDCLFAEINVDDVDPELIRRLSLMFVVTSLTFMDEEGVRLVAISNPYDTSILNDYKYS